jgi:hypothetical protein
MNISLVFSITSAIGLAIVFYSFYYLSNPRALIG